MIMIMIVIMIMIQLLMIMIMIVLMIMIQLLMMEKRRTVEYRRAAALRELDTDGLCSSGTSFALPLNNLQCNSHPFFLGKMSKTFLWKGGGGSTNGVSIKVFDTFPITSHQN